MSKRRKGSKKRRFKQTRLTTGPKLLRRVRILEKKVVAEVKTHTINATVNFDVGGKIVPLMEIGTGADQVLRSGNNIRVKAIKLNLYCFINALNAQARLRIVLLRDKQQVPDTAPTTISVFQTSIPTSHFNNNTPNRYDILWDRLFVLDNTHATQMFRRKLFMKTIVQWNGPAVGDIQKNGIYLFLIGETDVNPSQCIYNIRIEYYDN